MEKPTNIKDKNALAYIMFLESRLEVFIKSPYSNSYLALKKMVDRGNLQMAKAGDADIDFESESYKAISKFALSQKEFLETLDDYRKKMSPLEQKDLDAEMKEGAGIAEKVAMKNQDGKN